MSRRVFGELRNHRLSTVLFVSLVAALGMPLLASPASASGIAGAGFTTDDPTSPGSAFHNPCLNGQPGHATPAVNCNIYNDKRDVWINGGPSGGQNHLTAGDYFFAVLVPGGQPNPNDAGAKNLSDLYSQPWPSGSTNSDGSSIPSGDPYNNRTFHVDGSGHIDSYDGTPGTHLTDNTYSGTLGLLINLWPYDDTTNPGGVYILAICAVPSSPTSGAGAPGVNPSTCKYDAFKVRGGGAQEIEPPTITKDASGSYDTTYTWNISKSVDKTIVKQIGGAATFTYTVHVTHDAGSNSNVKVTGTISVFNFNQDENGNVIPIWISSVTDQLSDGTVCTVTGGGSQQLIQTETDFPYECDLGGLPQGQLDNTATVSWPDQGSLGASSASFTFKNISFSQNLIDNCTTITDPVPSGGTSSDNPFPTSVCVGDTGDGGAGSGDTAGFTFVYHTTYSVPANGCVSYKNTATESTDGNSSSVTVMVCGPAKTGALTIGFWKTTNGQSLIKYYCQYPALANYLRGLGSGSGPFSDAPTTSCTDLAGYVLNILKGASATNMNKMLKAQMMGTALDVWFSGPGWTSTQVGSIKPPSKFLSHNNLGTFNMDTTAICPMVDNLITGSATCTGGNPSTDAVAAGAVPSSPMSMQQILDFAATIDNSTPPWDVGAYAGSNVWYFNTTTSAQDRTKQEILKNIFDQFNNGDAFGSF